MREFLVFCSLEKKKQVQGNFIIDFDQLSSVELETIDKVSQLLNQSQNYRNTYTPQKQFVEQEHRQCSTFIKFTKGFYSNNTFCSRLLKKVYFFQSDQINLRILKNGERLDSRQMVVTIFSHQLSLLLEHPPNICNLRNKHTTNVQFFRQAQQ